MAEYTALIVSGLLGAALLLFVALALVVAVWHLTGILVRALWGERRDG